MVVAAAWSLLLPIAAHASWVGDFEAAPSGTNQFPQWDGRDGNRTLPHYFQRVLTPVAQGSFAFAAAVDPGAAVSGQPGQKSLLYLFPHDVPSQGKTEAYEGAERWYRSYVRFPATFQPAPNTDWNWVKEWHNWPNGPCCANLAVTVDTDPARGAGERLTMRVMGGGNATNPIEKTGSPSGNPAAHTDWYVGDASLEREHWYDLLTHVKWSSDPSRGLVEWWVDGVLKVSRQTSTLFWYADNNQNFAGATPGSGQAYYMEGYYRPGSGTAPATVYHDGARIGSTRASVGG